MTEQTPQRPEPSTTRSGTPGWVKLLLAASLTLNLMVVGLVVGARLGDGPPGRDPGPRTPRERVDPALGPFGRALPDNYRERATEDMRSRAGTFADNRGMFAAQLGEMLTLLRAERFDEDAFRAALEAQSQMFETRSQIGRDVVSEQIAAMSPEERQAVAEKLEKGFGRVLKGEPGRD
ncbi:periplasmic heavy metal sensor [Maritimibacter sp. DP1N21-5]|uniref:periplasmic heavy metal sensor n=1 Tax=Maritimibacter sp. DP1N21-5 TaxID=2836867 RepID=UPI001C4666BC|nr:periplasmic heavy metal sensor [Maritimibacter sp. DP1N21-5]MBV7409229.1 periplasmic heavy metal sensor [Maritimibacter sp. DP1N21-5]